MNDKLQLKAVVEKVNGKITVIASDETEDRSGEVVPVDAWDLENFRKSPRLLVDHDYSVKSIVGIADNIRIEGRKLLFEPRFHEITELANSVREMVEQGFLDTVSVGFMRKESGGKLKNELLEISFVAVPCNPSARTLSVKAIEPEQEKKVEEFLKDAVPEESGDEAPKGDESQEEPKEQADADKGMIEDVNEDNAKRRKIKLRYTDAIWMSFNRFVRAYLSDAVKIEDIKQMGGELADSIKEIAGKKPEELAGLDDIEFLSQMQELVAMKDIQATEKAGRVLSDKNSKLVKSAIESLELTVGVLKDLLEAAETSQGSGDKGADGGGTGPKERSSDAESVQSALEKWMLAKRVLRAVNTATAEALAQSKKLDK